MSIKDQGSSPGVPMKKVHNPLSAKQLRSLSYDRQHAAFSPAILPTICLESDKETTGPSAHAPDRHLAPAGQTLSSGSCRPKSATLLMQNVR